jgi:signal transduction histidine kinase
MRDRRNKDVAKVRELLDRVIQTLGAGDKRYLNELQRLEGLERTVTVTTPLYEELLAAPPVGDTKSELVERINLEETRAQRDASNLQSAFERRVANTTETLIRNEHTLRLRTIYMGLVAVALGLLVTTWVVVTLRPLRRLREGARRVAAGNYSSRVSDDGPTEVAELAREFNSMGVAIEERQRELVRSERLAAVGKMAAMIAHEVRNPLSSIGLNTELLADELGENSDEARELCRSIHREVDRLTAITEEYLARARFPTSKLVLERVNQIVSDLVEFIREDLAGRGVELTMELASGDPLAKLDAAQIRQCLINLVRNATDAVVAAGGGKVSVTTRLMGARVEIAVSDTGVGIPAEMLPKLYDPFFTTKEGGSGLGLALTQQIIHDHAGDLKVESTVGRGTTFTVSVPVGG